MAYDLSTSISRNARSFLTSAIIGYPWSRFVWNITMPYGVFLASSALIWTIMGPSQWISRLFRQQGIKPMGGTLSKLLYSVPYSWATFGGSIPLSMFAGDVNSWWKEHVSQPISHAATQCEELLNRK
jgi:hypothetical protein